MKGYEVTFQVHLKPLECGALAIDSVGAVHLVCTLWPFSVICTERQTVVVKEFQRQGIDLVWTKGNIFGCPYCLVELVFLQGDMDAGGCEDSGCQACDRRCCSFHKNRAVDLL